VPLSSAAWARSACEAALSAICEAVRASSSMAAVISTTEAACSEEPDASSEAISLTELAAEATSIELVWICCASTSSELVAFESDTASRPGRDFELSEQFTRSPSRRRSRACTSVSSIPSRRCSVVSTRSRRLCWVR
jgi:hypothetical protein